jgi:hypothetical protein
LKRAGFPYFDDIKELDHHCSDASEKCGSACALHLVAIPFDFNKCPFLIRDILADSRRVYLVRRR